MSSKSERWAGSQASVDERRTPRSLRLRLVLWYGTLLAVALIFFAALVLLFAGDALNQSVESAVRAEARVAGLEVSRELSPVPPYWPKQLSLKAIDTYREPGIVVEILDAQGNTRYTSSGNSATHISISADTTRATLAGQTTWYNANVDGGSVRVEAVPIRAPLAPPNTNATGQTDSGGNTPTLSTEPVIGTLLVARSLADVNTTLLLLQTLLLLSGLATLIGTLIGGWAIAANVLRPLREIATTAQAIAAATARGTRIGNLSQRVHRPSGRDEMAQVVDAFNEMLTDLEHATRTQRRFIADASHELRAPLTTIQGNLAFLQQHLDGLALEEQRTMLSDAHGETLRLARLVEELLLLARADANVDKPHIGVEETTADATLLQQSFVELDRVLLGLVRQLRGRLSVEGSPVKLEIGHIEPLRVRGDEESIRRVMLILLDNALKYTSMGTAKTEERVVVSLERREKEAVLRVSDTGIGIEPADLPHIFERFYRTDRARSREGTGLGLSIAQTLVEQLGGRITAGSTPGEGSTFSVWLPLA